MPATDKKHKRRRLLLGIITVFVIAVAAAGSYAWYEFNRKNKNLKNVKPDIVITSSELMKNFTVDLKNQDSLYKNKVVEITGVITRIDSTELPMIVFFGEKNSMSSIQCSLDPEHQPGPLLMVDNLTTIKGMYIGAISEELFGTDIKLNRCVIIN
jgi:hypothetical protein